VLLLHGFLQSSEAWVSTAHGLPFALADAGFDVWMANVRGNKYSCKHTSLSPHDDRYWNFSFDDVAQHDVPTNVRHVLSVTGFESLTFIGFSQGTACGFAALSLLPELNRMVHLFIALAPCTALHGFSNKLVDALTRTSPDIVYLIFGRRRLLPSVPFWQSVLSTRTYIYLIERSIALLFGWDMRNVWPEDKPVVYAHLYSFSSVKSVVHWFQLLQTGRFQMYDDHLWRQQSAAYQQPQYRLSQIRTAVALFPGGRDTLPNTAVTLAQLPPRRVLAHTIPSFEHMDFLYSKLACRELHPHVIALCRAAAAGETARDGDWARRMAARLKLGADGEGAVSVHAAAAAAAAAELSEGDGASAGAGGAGSWEALALGTRVSPMRTVGGVLVDDDDAADAPGGGDQLDDEDPLVREQREQEEARAEQERQSRELRDALREAEDECAAAGEQPNLQQDPQDDAEVLLQPPPLPQPRPQHRQRKRGAPRDGARV
jgi:pimeloyl-ACP methyl ester carboxylesterase